MSGVMESMTPLIGPAVYNTEFPQMWLGNYDVPLSLATQATAILNCTLELQGVCILRLPNI